MTAPKNASLPGQNWGFCSSPVQTFRQNRRLTASIFGCFESLIFTIFGITRQVPFFEFFCPPPLQQVFFPFFSRFHLQKLARRARRLPTSCARSARRLPDVCLLPKNSKRLAQPFFSKFGHQQEIEVSFL